MWGGCVYFGDKASGLDAGMLSFVPASKMMCVGGYGTYGKLGLGYWATGTDFHSIVTLESTNDRAPIQFNSAFSVIGKEGITDDVTFMRNLSHGPDNSFDIDYGIMHIWNGIIVGIE